MLSVFASHLYISAVDDPPGPYVWHRMIISCITRILPKVQLSINTFQLLTACMLMLGYSPNLCIMVEMSL